MDKNSLPPSGLPVFTGAGSCAEILITEDGLPIRPTGMCNVNQLFEANTEQASGRRDMARARNEYFMVQMRCMA
ncbi:MAG: hypothetical protein ACJ0RL_05050 [Porticoccaceae bacterium]